MTNTISNGKARINEKNTYLEILIPSKKNWFLLIFGSIWIIGLIMVIIFLTTLFFPTKLDGDNFFELYMLVFLILFCFFGLGVLLLILWGFFGIERLTINNKNMELKKHIFGLGSKKLMPIRDIKNIRYNEVPDVWFSPNPMISWGISGGKIKFDYGMRTFSVGLSLDEAEAKHIIQLIQSKIG